MESTDPTLWSHVWGEPPWLAAWIAWLIFVNVVSVVFSVRHTEARWVLVAFVVNVPLMNLLYDSYGYTRVLGLSHIVVWTPLLVFLLPQRSRFDPRTPFGGWLHAVMISNGISLAIDYVQVTGFLMRTL